MGLEEAEQDRWQLLRPSLTGCQHKQGLCSRNLHTACAGSHTLDGCSRRTIMPMVTIMHSSNQDNPFGGEGGRGMHGEEGGGRYLLHNLLKHPPDFRQHMHFSLHMIIQFRPFRTEKATSSHRSIRILDKTNRAG